MAERIYSHTFFMMPEYDEAGKMISPELAFQMKFPILRSNRKGNCTEFQTVGLMPRHYVSFTPINGAWQGIVQNWLGRNHNTEIPKCYLTRYEDYRYRYGDYWSDNFIDISEIILTFAYGFQATALLAKDESIHWTKQVWQLKEIEKFGRIGHTSNIPGVPKMAPQIRKIMQFKKSCLEYEQSPKFVEAWKQFQLLVEHYSSQYDKTEEWNNIFDLNVR